MAGYGAAIVNGVVQAGGAAVAVATAAKANFRKAPGSSDLTLIEKPWAWLRDDVFHSYSGGETPIDNGKSSKQLMGAAEQSWVNIPDDMISMLVDSTPQQIESFRKNAGARGY